MNVTTYSWDSKITADVCHKTLLFLLYIYPRAPPFWFRPERDPKDVSEPSDLEEETTDVPVYTPVVCFGFLVTP